MSEVDIDTEEIIATVHGREVGSGYCMARKGAARLRNRRLGRIQHGQGASAEDRSSPFADLRSDLRARPREIGSKQLEWIA